MNKKLVVLTAILSLLMLTVSGIGHYADETGELNGWYGCGMYGAYHMPMRYSEWDGWHMPMFWGLHR